MKREILSLSAVRKMCRQPEFSFLAAVLLCGILAGSVTGMRIPHTDGSYAVHLAELLSQNTAGQLPSVRTTIVCILGVLSWAAAVLFLAWLPGRYLWTAFLMAIRGFLLAFAAAAALNASGLWGIYMSFISVGIPAVFWIPAMLLIGTAALQRTAGSSYRKSLRRHSDALLCSLLLLLCNIVWKLLAVPALLGVSI